MIFYFEREGMTDHLAWLRRLSQAPDPRVAEMFRQQADDLSRRLNLPKDKPQ